MRTDGQLAALVGEVTAPDMRAVQQSRADLARLAIPPGALGRLADVAAQLAGVAGRTPPPVPTAPLVLVAAGDHGVHARGVSPWPQAITAAMAATMSRGRATINALARTVGAEVRVLDVGVHEGPPAASRVRGGTRDLTAGPAMEREEAAAALLTGAAAVEGSGCDLLVLGDMGIANTTPSACLTAALTGAGADAVTGRGTGIDDATLALKRRVVGAALQRHADAMARARQDPVGALAAVGGLEHAALVGALLAAAGRRVPVLLDGVTTTAAALVAVALAPDAVGYLLAGHLSPEPGAGLALTRLGLPPLLDLGLRVGEGTGGVLAVPLVQAAARLTHEVATLDDLAAGPGATVDGPPDRPSPR